MFNRQRAVDIIQQELSLFPLATLQDIYKLFYQATFGSAHFVKSREHAVNYLEEELASFKESKFPLEYDISYIMNIKRVSIETIALNIYSSGDLIEQFMEITHPQIHLNEKEWFDEWQEIKSLTLSLFPEIVDNLDNADVGIDKQFHHSPIFREIYNPHYRIIGITSEN